MDDETQQIFKEQLTKLPREVVDFLSSGNWSGDLDEIGSLYNLSENELYDFKSEATLVLAGLVHPDEFGDNLGQEAGIHGAVRDAIVTAVEQKIFAPVRSAIVDFLDKETEEAEKEEPEAPIASVEAPEIKAKKSTAWKSGSAPDNLPIAEAPEYLTPPIPSKPTNLDVQHPNEHPFEEKMKRVFTASQQSMGDLTLTPAHQNFSEKKLSGQVAPQAPITTQPSHSDPYREEIE